MKLIKLFVTADDLEFIETAPNVELDEDIGPIELAEVELRNGKQVRVTRDIEDDGSIVYMAVLFDDQHLSSYCVAETKEELNKWLINLQKK